MNEATPLYFRVLSRGFSLRRVMEGFLIIFTAQSNFSVGVSRYIFGKESLTNHL